MKKLFALIRARNLEFYRDRAALIWTILFPFVVLAGFAYGYSGKSEPLLTVLASGPVTAEHPLVRTLRQTPGLDFKVLEDESTALKKISRYEGDLAIRASDDGKRIAFAMNSDSDRGKLAESLLRQASLLQPEPRTILEAQAVKGRKIRYADWLLPGLLAMNIMFGSMFGVGYVIVRYRKNGVLKRLRATPLSAFQFLSAQVISRMLLMVVTSFMVIGGAMILIGFRPASLNAAVFDLLLFLSVSAAAMISVGLVVAAQISSEEVADGVLNLMTWPMIFLSGIWFSLDGASAWVVWISKLMPLSYVVKGLRAILIDGARFTDLMPEVGILLAITAVLMAVGSALFKWR
jgi:ABC-type multidrug transport system permease subunit